MKVKWGAPRLRLSSSPLLARTRGFLPLALAWEDRDEDRVRALSTSAVAKVRQKYMDDFAKTKDLYLFLGTTYLHHVRRARNPFVIIGTFHPPPILQPRLL